MRYPVSGSCTGAIASGNPKHLLGAGITSGRVLWLRKAWFYNTLAATVVSICDVSNGATGPTGATWVSNVDSVRVMIPLLSGGTLGSSDLHGLTVEFPAPGLKFTSYCTVANDLTTSGVIGAGGCGYEEG